MKFKNYICVILFYLSPTKCSYLPPSLIFSYMKNFKDVAKFDLSLNLFVDYPNFLILSGVQ